MDCASTTRKTRTPRRQQGCKFSTQKENTWVTSELPMRRHRRTAALPVPTSTICMSWDGAWFTGFVRYRRDIKIEVNSRGGHHTPPLEEGWPRPQKTSPKASL